VLGQPAWESFLWFGKVVRVEAALAGRLVSHSCRRIASKNTPSELMSRLRERSARVSVARSAR
jgi:hypothetical protein